MERRIFFNSIILFAVLFINATSLYAQTQHFKLQSKEYRYENGKWYTFFEGRKGDEIIPRRLIVKLKGKGYMENFDFQDYNIKGTSLGSRRFLDGFYVLSIEPDTNPFQIAEKLEKSGLFEILEFDAFGQRFSSPNDPYFYEQWNLTKINMPDAWNITTGSSSVILAIIDSGIKYTHEDLDGNIWVNPAEDYNGNGRPDFFPFYQGGDIDYTDNDGNGYVDDLIGWDFVDDDKNPIDTDGHGTNVAGVSSAQTNNYESGSYIGIAGVAGGWGAQKGSRFMVLRDGDERPTYYSMAMAIEYAAENGAKVINMSSGFGADSAGVVTSAVNLAVNTYDVVFVAAAGKGDTIKYPAAYSNTIAVGSTDQNDIRRPNYPFGPELDVMAPDGVISTSMSGGYSYNHKGTSFSAPHVAGLAALIRSKYPNLNWQQVRDIIRLSADKVSGMGGQDFTNYYGYGRINAEKALRNLYVPQIYPNVQSAINVAESGQNIIVGGTTSLSSNISIASNITLTIKSNATVTLGNYSINSTGGTIIKESGATINNLRATLKNGSTLKGLFSTIESACNAASPGYTVEIANGTYNESFTIYNKDNITITGANVTLNGTQSFYYCDYLEIWNLSANQINAYYCNHAWFYNEIDGSSSSIGLGLYNCTNFYKTGGVYNCNKGINAYATSGIAIGDIHFNNIGISAVSNSNVEVSSAYLCETANYDFSVVSSGHVTSLGNYFDSVPPRVYNSGGSVSLLGPSTCSYSIIADKGEEIYQLQSNDQIESDFNKINTSYFSLMKAIREAKEKDIPNDEELKSKLLSNIRGFKNFIFTYPQSSFASTALVTSANSYLLFDEYDKMKSYLDEIIQNQELSHLKNIAENLMTEYYRHTKDYNNAISSLDNVINNNKSTDDILCDALFRKSMILLYEMKQPEEAIKCLISITNNYKDNPLYELALDQLESIGKRAIEDPANSIADENNEFETSVYPNPFNPTTTIVVSLPQQDNIKLVVYDVLGREVIKLADGNFKAGRHDFTFNAANLPSGVYFYNIQTSGQSISKKMLLLK